MIKKLMPIVLLLVGVGGGVGAGLMLRPEVSLGDAGTGGDMEAEQGPGGEKSKIGNNQADENADTDTGGVSGDATTEFVKMNNQFVIPIVSSEKVIALVVMGLSIEVSAGKSDLIYRREPKLRDSFLQVLFDHANIGGFDGAFTSADTLGRLRDALREVAQRDAGKDAVKDVLIIEIARQDY